MPVKYSGHPFVVGRRYIMKSKNQPLVKVDGRIQVGSILQFFCDAHSIYESCYTFWFWNEKGILVSFTISNEFYGLMKWDDYIVVHPEDKDKPSW